MIHIVFDRESRKYVPNEKVTGSVIIASGGNMKHNGIVLTATGIVNFTLQTQSLVGAFTHSNTKKNSGTMFHYTASLAGGGTCKQGSHSYPFSFTLPSVPGLVASSSASSSSPEPSSSLDAEDDALNTSVESTSPLITYDCPFSSPARTCTPSASRFDRNSICSPSSRSASLAFAHTSGLDPSATSPLAKTSRNLAKTAFSSSPTPSSSTQVHASSSSISSSAAASAASSSSSAPAVAYDAVLCDSYHGVHINVNYLVTAEMVRGYITKQIKCEEEFIVYVPSSQAMLKKFAANASHPDVTFVLEPDETSLKAFAKLTHHSPHIPRPSFRVTGELCCFQSVTQPICGEILIQHTNMIVRSIEAILYRIEAVKPFPSSGHNFKAFTETTLVQTLEIVNGSFHGSPPCNLPIPIYMVLPRTFTCASLKQDNFEISFTICIKLYLRSKLMTDEFCVQTKMLPLTFSR